MSTREKLDSLAAELRRAVNQGGFEESRRLLGNYAAELERQLHSGQAGQAELQIALGEFEWARRNALSARAHASRRLSSTRAAARYSPRPPHSFVTLDLEA